MHAPEALHTLARAFHQDSLSTHSTLESYVAASIEWIAPGQRSEVKHYLQRLLSGAFSAQQVRDVWDTLPADIRIDDDNHLMSFLEAIRDAL